MRPPDLEEAEMLEDPRGEEGGDLLDVVKGQHGAPRLRASWAQPCRAHSEQRGAQAACPMQV